jgi:hypothetical protein
VVVGGTAPGEREIAEALPLSLRVGRRLPDEVAVEAAVELLEVPGAATAEEIALLGEAIARRPERVALLVMGDGSARRGEKALGYIDARAFEFDKHVGRALTDGDPQALLQLDANLAVELMVAGPRPGRCLRPPSQRSVRPSMPT